MPSRNAFRLSTTVFISRARAARLFGPDDPAYQSFLYGRQEGTIDDMSDMGCVEMGIEFLRRRWPGNVTG